MKILVYGAGVIGSYLAHGLMRAGNEVTLLARGQRRHELEQNGLAIRHYVQRKTTLDHPRIIGEIDRESYDIVFAAMQYQQMKSILADMAQVHAPLVMLVGNNLSAPDMAAYIHAHATTPRTVAFGFQTTGGRRENGQVICVRKGTSGLHCGLVHGPLGQQDKLALEQAFRNTEFRLNFQHDMYGWYLSHLAFILPVAYLCYALDCDLTKADRAGLRLCVDAAREGFDLLRALEVPILPAGEDEYFAPGPKRALLMAMLWIATKTALGRLMASDHCRNAVAEMRVLDEEFMALRLGQPALALPRWDALRARMPDWEQWSRRWQSGDTSQDRHP